MKITVIICTYNRCQSLARTLHSVACLTLPASIEWEILVVDNNSNDRTRAVVDEFCQRHPEQFRYEFESRQGKSHALNTGIRASRGDILAFIDDDVTVEPTWLQNLTANLGDARWAGAAGRILPDRDFSPPRWIVPKGRYSLAPLALFNPDLEAGPLVEPPYGANMAFQKMMFEKYGGFRTDLGPGVGSGAPQKSEDSEFGHRLLAAGEKLRYEPSAVVYHGIPTNRVQKSYFLEWWYDKSRADVRVFGIPPEIKWTIGGIPLKTVRRLAVWAVRWIFTFEPARRFDAKIAVWGKMGEITEFRRMSREATERRSWGA